MTADLHWTFTAAGFEASIPEDLTLGCCSHRIVLTDRCGYPAIGELTSSQLEYERVLDDTGSATITFVPDDTAGCCERLGRIAAWGTEVLIFRCGEPVWLGPVVNVKWGRDQVKVIAKDVSAWLDVRTVHNDYDWTTGTGIGPEDIGLIAWTIIHDAMLGGAPPDPPATTGQTTPGNIDITQRIDGPRVMLIGAGPTARVIRGINSQGFTMTQSEAEDYYFFTLGHFGVFDTWVHANIYATALDAYQRQLHAGGDDPCIMANLDIPRRATTTPEEAAAWGAAGVPHLGVQVEFKVKACSVYAGDVLRELAKIGLDFTVLGRSIIIRSELATASQATLASGAFLADLEVEQRGEDTATWACVTGQTDTITGLPAQASFGGTDAYYGRVEQLATLDHATDNDACLKAATSRVQGGKVPPLFINVPDGAQLSPDAPVAFHQLVPGEIFDLLIVEACKTVTQQLRLTHLRVSDAPPDGEKVGVGFAPTGTTGRQVTDANIQRQV